MSAPELDDLNDPDEQTDTGEPAEPSPTPSAETAEIAALRQRILELEAEVGSEIQDRPAAPVSPADMVTADIPLGPTGHALSINGKDFVGRKTLRRTTLQQLQSMLSAKIEIERERMLPRGNMLLPDQLAQSDAASQIIARQPSRVISGT